jgi:tyrosyl-tRNA synthetase
MQEHNKDPSKRVAQHKLAREVLELVHSDKIARETELQHRILFQKDSASVPMGLSEDAGNPIDPTKQSDQTDPVEKKVPTPVRDTADKTPFRSLTLPRSLVYNQPISRVLYHAGMVSSRSEGHRIVKNKGVYLGARPSAAGTMGDHLDWSPALTWEGSETEKYIIGENTLMLRVGKWNVKIIKIISDEDFEAEGLTAPGWKEENEEKPLTEGLRKMKSWHAKNYLKQASLHQRRPGPRKSDEDWDKPLRSYIQ